MQAKFTRYPFSSSEATAKAPLDEVVMDVVGPLELGAAGAEYFLTIVDVYTRMTWVYVLSKKSDVAETVKTDWLPMVERQQNRLAKIGVRFGEVKISGLEHVELPLELSSGSTTTRQSSLVNGREEAKDAEEEEEEVQQVSERAPTVPSRIMSAPRIQQNEKVDYKELFSPVVKPTTLRTLLAGAAIKGWVVKQMCQLEGFDDGSGRVWKLKKALYGLKQAPRQWYLKLREVLEEIGFTPSSADHSLFMLGEGEQRIFMVVDVDDILIFSPSSNLVKEVMLKLQDKFKCKALGDVSFYLWLHIERDVEKWCKRCVKGPEEESVGEEERRRFHSLGGSLMYTAVNTRPDIAFATGQLARVVQCHNEEQEAAGMRVAKYLGQTATVGLQYSAAAQRRKKGADGVESGRLFLTAFSDASYASEPENMTSVGGFICCIVGGPTVWESKKQVDQALSSVESEYMALFRFPTSAPPPNCPAAEQPNRPTAEPPRRRAAEPTSRRAAQQLHNSSAAPPSSRAAELPLFLPLRPWPYFLGL
ncbi:unnamed protein product, partial [Closterium sp. NIES-54]